MALFFKIARKLCNKGLVGLSKRNVIILGDSTSVSFGRNEANYVDLMAKTPCWPEELTFKNYSFPGATSFDMHEAFKNLVSNRTEDVFGVIIYLGHCDSVSSPLVFKKNFLQKLFAQKKDVVSEKETVALSQNRFRPLKWNDDYNSKLEKYISPNQYSSNLENIIKICRKNKIRVYLVNPIANEDYPPGLGKGNFSFYHYVGLKDEISSSFQIFDERFVNAYSQKERGNFRGAAALYDEILGEPPEGISSREYLLLVANNFAACLAEDGKLKEAKKLFHVLMTERDIRREIILYNLYVVERRLGSVAEAQKYKKLSYDCDFSLYRIKESYRNQLSLLAPKYGNVNLIDMECFLENIQFYDHCHLDETGHQFLAGELIERFSESGELGSKTATVKNEPLNPKACKSDFQDFFNFNSAFTPPSDFNFDALMSELGEDLEFEKVKNYSFDEKIFRTLEEYKTHPLSHTKKLLLNLSPEKQYFWGKFPEFAIALRIYQLTLSYPKSAKGLFSSYPTLFEHLNLDKQVKFLAPLVNSQENLLDEKFDQLIPVEDVPKVEERISECLNQFVTNNWTPQNRIKLTLIWYAREALRFGGQSRNDCLFDLLNLEKLFEAMFVLMLSMCVNEGKVSQRLRMLAGRLENLISIYKKYSAKVINEEFEIDNTLLQRANSEKNQI